MKAIRRNQSAIKRLFDQIAGEFLAEKIILLGSHAYGKPQWDSDIDLLVIMPFKGTFHRQAVEIRSRINAGMALDLLVRTPEHVKRRFEMGDSFIREIFERGKVVYEAVATPMGLHRVAQGFCTQLPWDT
jgi:predicted nucleotidyltransferase